MWTSPAQTVAAFRWPATAFPSASERTAWVGEPIPVEKRDVADATGDLERFVELDRVVLAVLLVVEPTLGVLDRTERAEPRGVGVDLLGQ